VRLLLINLSTQVWKWTLLRISVDFSLSYVPSPMNNQSDVSSNEEVEDDDDFCEELLDEVRSATYAKT